MITQIIHLSALSCALCDTANMYVCFVLQDVKDFSACAVSLVSFSCLMFNLNWSDTMTSTIIDIEDL